MHKRRATSFRRPSLSFILFGILLGLVWLSGGASRPDAFGQTVTRGLAWILLIVGILFAERPSWAEARGVLVLLISAILLPLVQLVPLPPSIWQTLPGREILLEAAAASGQLQPWRPLSMVPGATLNAASSLVVPLATLLFVLGVKDAERAILPGFMLCLIVASSFIALLQFSGAGFNNPLINDAPGDVSGTFANRNHLALFLAFGCVLAPVWAFLDGRRPGWRAPVSLGVIIMFTLVILATGSRAGLILGIVGICLGAIIVRKNIAKEFRAAPAWVVPAVVAAIIGIILIFVLISIAADRAEGINRALDIDISEEKRRLALPTVLSMIMVYFPWGSGLGAFDPIYRIHEPFSLLDIKYFNHAHNDFLEVALDAGLPGILLLLCATCWWLFKSLNAWRSGSSVYGMLPKLGSAMLLLLFLASVFDYPARTPLIMATMVVAGVWLSGGAGGAHRALPSIKQHL